MMSKAGVEAEAERIDAAADLRAKRKELKARKAAAAAAVAIFVLDFLRAQPVKGPARSGPSPQALVVCVSHACTFRGEPSLPNGRPNRERSARGPPSLA